MVFSLSLKAQYLVSLHPCRTEKYRFEELPLLPDSFVAESQVSVLLRIGYQEVRNEKWYDWIRLIEDPQENSEFLVFMLDYAYHGGLIKCLNGSHNWNETLEFQCVFHKTFHKDVYIQEIMKNAKYKMGK